jgi:hypothetical protein
MNRILCRLGWVALLVLAMVPDLSAHIGMPFVVLEGKAGRYPVRVVVQQPEVVPGLAHIGVRVLEGTPKSVSVLPLHWDTDRSGAPRPDPARPVAGEAGLYEGELWFMGSGAYGVIVQIEGEGGGSLVVPANSLATVRKAMPVWMAWLLGSLGVLLGVGWVAIGYSTFRESTVVGAVLGRRWRGALGAGLGLLAAGAAVVGGSRWWKVEDRAHAAKVRGQTMKLDVRQKAGSLEFVVRGRGEQGPAWDLVPDHGRLMHAFVIGMGPEPVFLHMHPEEPIEGGAPRSAIGSLPAGEYEVFLDVTHEMGVVQTLTNRLTVREPVSGGVVTDRDDSWHRGALLPVGQAQPLDGGRTVRLEVEGRLRALEPVRMVARFRESDDRPCLLEPYLRMPGHAVVAAADGSVFTHLHPAGNLSMAAARRFALRAGGDTAAKDADEVCGDLGALPADVVGQLLRRGEVTFPMVFPKAGTYRVWVQARIGGQIQTAGFLIEVETSAARPL